jgi:hypothetical protein
MRLNGPEPFGRLNGQQIGEFREALLDAFPTVAALDQFLLLYLNRQRQRIALGDDLDEIAFKIIGNAEAKSWTAELLAGARTASPLHEGLRTFAEPFGLAPATPRGVELQKTIREANATLDPSPWRRRMATIEGQVCRVEVYSGIPPQYGTGFLLGPDIVMTNYHVVEPVIKGEVTPDKVALRFDYKALEDGVGVGSGTVYELALDGAPGAGAGAGAWLIDSSPYSPIDMNGGPGDPSPKDLDYALLRVKGKPGADPVGGPKSDLEKPLPPRGWIDIPARAHDFKKFKTVFILQHPDDRPLKFAMDTNSVLGVNDNGTRVRYATNTAPGSSGAPCFDGDWNLIALHHAGDPKYQQFVRAEYNQGIPLAPILALLTEHGTRDLLGRA